MSIILAAPDEAAEHGNALPETWSAIKAAHQYEFRLRDALRSLDVPVYLPVYYYYREGEYKHGWVTAPLFSGYLFARKITDQDHAGRIHEKLRQSLPVKAKFYAVGDLDVSVLRAIWNREDEQGRVKMYDELAEGEQVVIESGSFAGFTAPVRKILQGRTTADERVVLLLSLLGRQHEVTFERREVRRLSA